MAQSKKTFVSCIKVKGIHLLPPVISEKKRIELQQYRQQAVKLEKRLKNCRELKKNLEELLNFQPLTDRPPSEITFRDDGHIEALGITERGRDVGTSSKKVVLRKINLSKDIIDVTEYNNDGIKIIQNDSDSNCDDLSQGQELSNQNNIDASFNERSNGLFQPTNCEGYSTIEQSALKCPAVNNKIKNDMTSQSKPNDIAALNSNLNETLKDISPEKSPRPRLIRSNSYTLDSPSPILLAHLQKTSKKGEQQNSEQNHQFSQSRNWSSLENNYIPFENSEFSSINTVYNNDEGFSNKKDITNNTPSDKFDSFNTEKQVSPTIEVIQTDISVQQITVNTIDKFINEKDKGHQHEENTLNVCDISDPDSQLMQILRSIPENYSKQIIELIQNQKVDPQDKLTSTKKNMKQCVADNFRKDVITSTKQNYNNEMRNGQQNAKENLCSIPSQSNFCNYNIHTSSKHGQDISASFSNSTTSVSPSQSIHYSISSDTIQTPSSPIKLIDLEYDYDKTLSEKCGCGLEDSKDILELYIQEEIKKGMNVSRELFPQINATSIHTIKQEWAASVIGAHVKGYLTRRLLKTERVQALIDTIKDALICALQLHNAENIDESDVELHRRLINQVSAACYAFHDIFFSLSVQEQMSIISTDRQRKIEKAKRPSSAPGSHRSKSTSSRSSSKQRLQSQTQSLTKV